MTTAQVKETLTELGVAVDKFTDISDVISRIVLDSDQNLFPLYGSLYRTQFEFDTTNGLLVSRNVDEKDRNRILKVNGYWSFSEIVSIETLNPYSESEFSGNAALLHDEEDS